MAGPYDRLFKTLAEDDPRGLLHLFGILPLGVEARIEPLDRELNLPTLSVDHVYRVQSGGREWLSHLEAQVRYRSDIPERLAWYAQALALKFKLPVETVLILLVERFAPAYVPTSHHLTLGSVHISVEYRVLRLWEHDPQPVLASGRRALLPWVTLLRCSTNDLMEAARQISLSGDLKLAAEFVVLGGLRYDKDDLASMLGRLGAMLTQEMIEESSFYQMVLEKGVKTGRTEEARRTVRRVLALRFPALGAVPELDAIQDPERLEQLHDALVLAKNLEEARSALADTKTQ